DRGVSSRRLLRRKSNARGSAMGCLLMPTRWRHPAEQSAQIYCADLLQLLDCDHNLVCQLSPGDRVGEVVELLENLLPAHRPGREAEVVAFFAGQHPSVAEHDPHSASVLVREESR